MYNVGTGTIIQFEIIAFAIFSSVPENIKYHYACSLHVPARYREMTRVTRSQGKVPRNPGNTQASWTMSPVIITDRYLSDGRSDSRRHLPGLQRLIKSEEIDRSCRLPRVWPAAQSQNQLQCHRQSEKPIDARVDQGRKANKRDPQCRWFQVEWWRRGLRRAGVDWNSLALHSR